MYVYTRDSISRAGGQVHVYIHPPLVHILSSAISTARSSVAGMGVKMSVPTHQKGVGWRTLLFIIAYSPPPFFLFFPRLFFFFFAAEVMGREGKK